MSVAKSSDYSAISIVQVVSQNFYVLAAGRGRWDYEVLKEKAMRKFRQFGKDVTFIVEAAGAGISLIKFLRDQGCRCFHYYPKVDKQTRAAYALPIVAEGRVHIVNRAGSNQWVEDYINEFVNFPYGRFDDQVDSLTQLLPWADKRPNPKGGFYGIA